MNGEGGLADAAHARGDADGPLVQELLAHPFDLRLPPREVGQAGLAELLEVKEAFDNLQNAKLARADLLLASDRVMGNGLLETIHDVVYVRPESFESRLTPAIALELEELNREELFSLQIGKMDNQIDLFQVGGVMAGAKNRIYMRDGLFYLANGNSAKIMELSSYGFQGAVADLY